MREPDLFVRPLTEEQTSFDNDLLSRREFGNRLTGTVNRLANGGVIAIDGQWGSGKTTFIKMWQKERIEEHPNFIFLDAFESDHADDPFLPIIGAILEYSEREQQRSEDHVQDLTEKSFAVMRLLAGAALSTGLSSLSGGALNENLGDELVTAVNSPTSVDKALWANLQAFKKRHQTIQNFRETLGEWASGDESGTPLVFVIDELDRCKPDFAIALLDRLKHLFNTKGIVFILMLNRDQMLASVETVYGRMIGGENYLSKFVDIFHSLPKLNQGNDPYQTDNFIAEVLNCISDSNNSSFHHISQINSTAKLFGLSVREIEKFCSAVTLVLSRSGGYHPSVAQLMVVLVAIKMKHPKHLSLFKTGQQTLGDFDELMRLTDSTHTDPYDSGLKYFCFLALDETELNQSEFWSNNEQLAEASPTAESISEGMHVNIVRHNGNRKRVLADWCVIVEQFV